MFVTAFGRRLRQRRRLLGLSQQELGDAIGVRFQQIQKYENGANRISFSRLVQIARALKCRVTDLMDVFDGADAECVYETSGVQPKTLHAYARPLGLALDGRKLAPAWARGACPSGNSPYWEKRTQLLSPRSSKSMITLCAGDR